MAVTVTITPGTAHWHPTPKKLALNYWTLKSLEVRKLELYTKDVDILLRTEVLEPAQDLAFPVRL